MNKRQKKKRLSQMKYRAKHFNQYIILRGRKNGKYLFMKRLHNAVCSNKYKPFEDMKEYIKGVMPID